MDTVRLLFSFKGRINRAKYWLAALAMVGWLLLVAFMVYLWLLLVASGHLPAKTITIHIGLDDIFAIFDPAAYRRLSSADIILRVFGLPLLVWIYCATSIKRLHDRDKSGWWLVPYFVVPGLYSQFSDRLPGSYVIFPFTLAIFLLVIWGGIELFFLGGSLRTNMYGPNPLPKTQMRSRSDRAGSRTTSGWDQQSELR